MNNYVESLGKMIKALHTHLTTVFAPKEVHIVQTMQSTPKEGDVLISYSTSIEAEGFHNTITYEERDVEGTPTLFMQDNRQDELMLKFVAYDRETVDGVAVNIAEEVYD